MKFPPVLFVALLVSALPAAGAPAASVTIRDCLVSLIEDIQVPAQEAGVLMEVVVREGHQVQAGDLLARIDDAHTRMQLEVAELEQKVATEQANNDTNIEYARAASKVAESEYQRGVEANEKFPGTVPPAEMERRLLTYRKTLWEIKQAAMNKHIAELEAKVTAAKVKAAEESLRRRRILSPINAEVEEVHRRKGEWVEPGDDVLHIVQVDLLRVEGFLNTKDVSRGEVLGRNVTVRVNLARGQVQDFQGKVVFVSRIVRAGGEFKVRAEVQNRRVGNNWLLSPGLPAQMAIHLN